MNEQYFETTGFSHKPKNSFDSCYMNEYDSCLLFHSKELFSTLLEKLLPLHFLESDYSRKNLSHKVGRLELQILLFLHERLIHHFYIYN